MDNTGFILDFLRDLEVEMKKIGLKSVIDLKILKRDMFLKDDNTLGVMFVGGIPTYILTSVGRVKILGEAFRGKNLDLDKKNNYINLFFRKYKCKLSNNLNSSTIYSIKKVPMVNYELEYLSSTYDSKDGFMGIDWYKLIGKLNKDLDANVVFLCEDDIINIGNLVEMAIVKVGMPSESFSGDIRYFCYTLLSGLQLYIDDFDMVATKKDKYKKQLTKYLDYFALYPKEERGLNFTYDYNKTFLNGIGVLEITKDDQVLYGLSDERSIKIDKYNGLSLEIKNGKKCNQQFLIRKDNYVKIKRTKFY